MKKYQNKVDAIFKKYGWEYWPPFSILARLFEEGGEFARLVNHMYGPKKKKSTEAKQNLEHEIGDILYTLICFANSNNINLDRAIEKSIATALGRDKTRWRKKSKK